MTQPTPPLRDALAAVEKVRSNFMTSTEEALANLVVALVQEVEHLRRDLMVSTSAGGPAMSGADHNLRAEVEELRRQLAGHEAMLAQMGFDPTKRRAPRQIVDPPRTERSVEYLAQNLPDLGEGVDRSQIQSHLQRPRVRPEDIQLTQEDLARQEREIPAWYPPKTSKYYGLFAVLIVGALLVVYLGLVFIMVP